MAPRAPIASLPKSGYRCVVGRRKKTKGKKMEIRKRVAPVLQTTLPLPPFNLRFSRILWKCGRPSFQGPSARPQIKSTLFFAQDDNRVDPRGTPGRNEAGDEGDDRQDGGYGGESCGIGRGDTIDHRLESSHRRERCGHADR